MRDTLMPDVYSNRKRDHRGCDAAMEFPSRLHRKVKSMYTPSEASLSLYSVAVLFSLPVDMIFILI